MQAHNAIWESVNGPIPPGYVVDHINGDTCDNRIENLRLATRSQNNANSRIRSDNKSGVKGVSWDSSRNRWVGTVKMNGTLRTMRGGLLEVVAFVRSARLELHGEFARF